MPWTEAIDQPGAGQMQYGRALMESRPFLTRIPDPDVIVTGRVPTSVPGAGRYRFVVHPRCERELTRWCMRRSAGHSRCEWR